MSRVLILTLFLSILTIQSGLTSSYRLLPDSNLTPGYANPDVTQENLDQTICDPAHHWRTRDIRPPVHYTNRLKHKQIEQYSYDDKDPRHYEEDHLIPLWLGGHPSDPRNLWPESRRSYPLNAYDKDKVENWLHNQVCEGRITLKEAQEAIARDWVSLYYDMIGRAPDPRPEA